MATNRADPRPHSPEVDEQADYLRDSTQDYHPRKPTGDQPDPKDLTQETGARPDQEDPIRRLDSLGTVAGIALLGARKEPERDPEEQEDREANLDRRGMRRAENR